MAYTYEKQLWKDYPDTTTPITADRLNHMEDGISEAAKSGGGDTIPESYSTDEVKTNKTWIDGKPLYRKTFSFNNINIAVSDYNWTRSLELSDISYITVDETHSYFVIGNQRYPINYSQPQYNSGSSYRLSKTSTNMDFIFYKTNNFSVSDIILIVEYTKTTD